MLRRLNVSSILLGAAVIVGVEGASNIFIKPVMAATFTLTQNQGLSGVAFEDLNYAFGVLDQQINSPVPITVGVFAGTSDQVAMQTMQTPSDLKNVVAEAASTSLTTNVKGGLPNTEYPIALANAINDTSPSPKAPDVMIYVITDGFKNTYFGEDPTADPFEVDSTTGQTASTKETDFISVIFHEIAHGLGIDGTATKDQKTGTYSLGIESDTPQVGSDANNFEIYDRFVVNGSGQPIISFANNSKELGAQLTSNGLYFNGPNAIAANGGTPPKLYAPSDFAEGTSYNHLDEATYDTSGSLNADLIPFTPPQNTDPVRQLGPITLGILADEGWSVNQGKISVPEPMPLGLDTLAASILGIGYLLNNQRKQKKKETA